MPGQLDDWIRVHLKNRLAGVAGRVTSALSAPFRSLSTLRLPRSKRTEAPTRRRGAGVAAVIGTLVVLTGGTVAYGAAHKTISLDVDGKVTSVTTYAGSVEGLLEARGIDVGSRDTVAPETATALADGSEIVIRHATLVKVQVDGAKTDVWTTALSADEALGTLASRGGEVSLVASRSASGGRAELPLDLTLEGPVKLKADNKTRVAPGGLVALPAVLDHFDIKLAKLDEVSVQHPANGAVTVVVNRVVKAEVSETHPVEFAKSEQPDAEQFVGEKSVTTPGVAGERTIVSRVTTVDGAETARRQISDTLTREPVAEVTGVGTKERPVAPKPAPAPAAAAAPAAPANPNVGGSADSLNWAALAACESGGRPTAVSSNGMYHGLYQFSTSTWSAMGGSGLPSAAPAEEQTMRAKMLYNASGAGQWPHCGPQLFS